MKTRLSGAGYGLLLLFSALLLLAASAAGLSVGSVRLELGEVLGALLDAALGGERASSTAGVIVTDIRLPRVLGGIVVGGTLAVVGASLQAVMKNPLAEPYILGISSGASMGASIAVVLGAESIGGPGASLAGFSAALLGVFLVSRVAEVGGLIPPVRLLLAGVALSSFGTAVTGFVLYLTPDATEVRGVVFWLMGGLGAADSRGVAWTALITLPVCLLSFLGARALNLLLLGDETALSLGLDVARARKVLIALSALGIGAVVSFSGSIGFVGLVVPHALRPFTGPDHRRLLPAVFLFGATLLVVLDTVARVVIAPAELPVGILSGLLGAPFFIVLLARLKEDVFG